MPRKLRRLTGPDVIRILQGFGFAITSQRGSHAKLRRQKPGGGMQTLVVPIHRELDTATLRATVRQASRYVSPEVLEVHFCTS